MLLSVLRNAIFKIYAFKIAFTTSESASCYLIKNLYTNAKPPLVSYTQRTLHLMTFYRINIATAFGSKATTASHGMISYRPTASNAPIIGPHSVTIPYPQLELPLPLIGRTACAKRGPRSRAGFIAYPVSPPKDIPQDTIIPNTNKFPTPAGAAPGIPLIANTSTKVATTSAKMLRGIFGMDGPQENTPNLVPGSSVASNSGL